MSELVSVEAVISSWMLHLVVNPDSASTGARSIKAAIIDRLAKSFDPNSVLGSEVWVKSVSVYSTELGEQARRGAVASNILSMPMWSERFEVSITLKRVGAPKSAYSSRSSFITQVVHGDTLGAANGQPWTPACSGKSRRALATAIASPRRKRTIGA